MELVKGQKAVVVGYRNNPQLGTYLTGPYIVKVERVNKASYKIAYGEDGQDYYPTLFTTYGYAKKDTECAYGSMFYKLMTVEDAVGEFKRYGTSKGRDDYFKKAELLQKEFAA